MANYGEDGANGEVSWAKAMGVAERRALALVPRDQVRTWSVLAVSLASLLYKSEAFSDAERAITSLLESEALLPWAREEHRELLEAVSGKPMVHR